MPNRANIQKIKFILTIVLTIFATLFFSTIFVFGAFNTGTQGGQFNVEYIPVDEIQYTASALNTKLINTENLQTITFDYSNPEDAYYDANNNNVKEIGKPYVEFTNYSGSSPIYSYIVKTASSTDVYFLCKDDIIAPTDCSYMFGMFYVTSITFKNFNTTNIINMSNMFYGCYATNLDLTSFNTTNVTDMSFMFGQCASLESLDLSSFDTNKVTNMYAMFSECYSLTDLDLSNFNTSNVTNMGYMFDYCSSLTSIYVDSDKWSTSSVSNGSGMFNYCVNLVGGAGTVYNPDIIDETYAHVDGKDGLPGYLSYISTLDMSLFRSKVRTYSNVKKIVFDYSYKPEYESIISTYTPVSLLSDGTNGIAMYADTSSNYIYILSKYDIIPNNTSLYGMFGELNQLKTIEFNNFKTSNVTDMGWMFHSCSSLESLDLSGFDTSSVTNISNMFYMCSSLESLDLSSFDTSNVTDMGWMFHSCSSLTSLDLSSFNTSKVKDMSYMFAKCSSLTSLNLSSFDTRSVLDMDHMFWKCSSLESLDLSSFNTSSVKYMDNMFYECSILKTIYVDSEKWSTSSVSTSIAMFKDCLQLVGGAGTIYNSLNVSKTYACVDDPDNGKPGYLTQVSTLDMTLFKSNVGSKAFQKIVFDYSYKSKYATIISSYTPVPMASDGTTGIALYIDISQTIVYILSEYNIRPNSIVLNSMFSNLGNLELVEFYNFNTSNVIDMKNMFNNCSSLTSLDLSSLDTSNVTDMFNMFGNCSSLTSLDLSSFDTNSLKDMGSMFHWCTSLTNLNVSSFDTSNVTSMGGMFSNCSSLTSLDLSSFNTSNVKNTGSMFRWCDNLTTIYVDSSKWSTTSITESSYMFLDCNKLIGGAGTAFNSSKVDKTYARVDGGPSSPGYFTAKS